MSCKDDNNTLNNYHNVIVVMVPFLAQGHLNQLLHLSRLVASHGLPVYYVGFDVDIRLARSRIHGWDPTDFPTLKFRGFPTPPSYIPGANPTTQAETFSEIISSVVWASGHMRTHIAELLDDLAGKCGRLVVVHDSLMASSVQEAASVPHAEAYSFHAASAFTNATLFWEVAGKTLRVPLPLWKLLGRFLLPSRAVVPDGLPSMETCFTPEFREFMAVQRSHSSFCSGNIYDTCRPIEGPYVDLLSRFYKWTFKGKIWAVGPINPIIINSRETNSKQPRHRSLEWLDKQPSKSVIFVSFGTLNSFSDEQISEIAIGLEQSQQKFIWAIRDVLKGEKGKITLPEGYEERVQLEGQGLVLWDWAPQLDILDHPSTGGFLTHCGWNSCMESIGRGIPLATWPIHFDQPRNAVLMTEVLKIGIAVKEWERRDEVISSETVRRAIVRLMASPEGEELRSRVVELGKEVRDSVANGGVSRIEMENFVAHITR